MKSLKIKRGKRAKSLRFHPWIFRSQIEEADLKACEPGSLVEASDGGHFLGRGYINPASEISIRLLSFKSEPIHQAFITGRIKQAVDYRLKTVKNSNAMRLVSSEADLLPGLIIDKYGEILVVQIMTLGMEKLKPLVFKALEELFPAESIYEKSDSGSRKREGLDEVCGWVRKNCGAQQIIHEGKIQYTIEVEKGHKTGFYLDQRDNRLLLGGLVTPGQRVLDCFSYTGGFGLHMAKAGAVVTAIESQDDAVRQATENRKLNGISESSLTILQENAFDALKSMDQAQEVFDWVILDPPSFVKSRAAVDRALGGFKEIALRSLKLLKNGGHLAVFSCSYHVDQMLLLQVCLAAAFDVKKRLKILQFMQQASDHPIDPFIPETFYLKGILFYVSND